MAKRYKFAQGTTYSNPTDGSRTLIGIKLPDIATQEQEDTTLEDTVMKTIPSGINEAGEAVLTVPYEPGNQMRLGPADEVHTITLPIYGTDGVANTITGTGHVTAITAPEFTISPSQKTQDITIKCNSIWNFNENN